MGAHPLGVGIVGAGAVTQSIHLPTIVSLSDRLAVMKNGKLVGTYRTADVTEDEVLGMIIAGKRPEGREQAPHAATAAPASAASAAARTTAA